MNTCILLKCNSYWTVENNGLLHSFCSRNLRVSPFNGVYPMLSPDDGAVTCSPVSDNAYNYLINKPMNVNFRSHRTFNNLHSIFQHLLITSTPSPNIYTVPAFLLFLYIFFFFIFLFLTFFKPHVTIRTNHLYFQF